MVRAAFPEKDDAGERRGRREPEEAEEAEAEAGDGDDADEAGPDRIAIVEPVRLAPVEVEAVPAPVEPEDEISAGVRIGAPRALHDELTAERAAMAEIVAEVAAVERMQPEEAEATAEAEADEPKLSIDVAPPPPPPPEAPIIVEPASAARLRDEEAAAGRAGAGPDGEGQLATKSAGEKLGFIKLGEGAFELPGHRAARVHPARSARHRQAAALRHGRAPGAGDGELRRARQGQGDPHGAGRDHVRVRARARHAHRQDRQPRERPGDGAGGAAVRIVAPIPGKAVVGVEVPNKTRETVYLKEILEDDCFTKARPRSCRSALGKDIKGAPVSVNLSKMPHLLVAGTTGSGKSVAVNAMITSLLYNATPEEVRFIMVDPKMLELSIYEGIPHLLLPVVTDPKKANLALRWAVEEMERRYELLAKTGVRDIASYNAKVEAGQQEARRRPPAEGGGRRGAAQQEAPRWSMAGADGSEQRGRWSRPTPEITMRGRPVDGDSAASSATRPPSDEDCPTPAAAAQAAAGQGGRGAEAPAKLPYIVIVIDEFADLMMVAPKDVETSVARIAQKARAAGMHLILATQRPSVDVITGLIKANFPSRIALQVASQHRLAHHPRPARRRDAARQRRHAVLGPRHQAAPHPRRLPVATTRSTAWSTSSRSRPSRSTTWTSSSRATRRRRTARAPADDFHDELYDQAVAIVCDTRQASVSYIQRRLQIGYNRAARMVEQMERDGIVGPANGAKPREVLAPPGEYLAAGG